MCEHCGSTGHPGYACDQMDCELCGKKGHTARSCPGRDDEGD